MQEHKTSDRDGLRSQQWTKTRKYCQYVFKKQYFCARTKQLGEKTKHKRTLLHPLGDESRIVSLTQGRYWEGQQKLQGSPCQAPVLGGVTILGKEASERKSSLLEIPAMFTQQQNTEIHKQCQTLNNVLLVLQNPFILSHRLGKC